MGSGEAAKPSNSDKASSLEQPTIHPYPDWATLPAYYGPGIPMPPPYLTAAVASGQAHHPYIWGPQAYIPPYGAPYPAIYTHGVYSNTLVPPGSHSNNQGIAPSPCTNEAVVMAIPLSIEPSSKTSSNKDRDLLKKLKGLDGLPVPKRNDNTENSSGLAVCGLSQSGESGVEGSSIGSDGSDGEHKCQRSSDDTRISGKDGMAVTVDNAVYGVKTNGPSRMPLEVSLAPTNIAGNPVGHIPSSKPTPGMVSRVSADEEVKSSAALVPPATTTMALGRDGVPVEHWIQDERALKRERRKQSNRESARRSRLRKQAETEELALKVDALDIENSTLRSEIIRVKEKSERLRLENSALTEKLKSSQHMEEALPEKVVTQAPPPSCTENFLSRMNNSDSFGSSEQQESKSHGSSSTKLHQLLGPSPRTDAVAAG